MARKRVIAYFMHEDEAAAAYSSLENAESTGSFVMGDIDEAEIQALEGRGLIVRVMAEKGQPESESDSALELAPDIGIEAVPMTPDAATYFTVRLVGPLLPRWRREMEQCGAEIVEALGRDRYSVRLLPSDRQAVADLEFVAGMPELFNDADSGPPLALESTVMPSTGTVGTYEVMLHRADDSQLVEQWLKAREDAFLVGAQRRKIRFNAAPDSPVHGHLRALPEVFSLHPVVEPKLHNDRANDLLGLVAAGAASSPLPWNGQGQLVGVADSGLDQTHPDFGNRVRQAVALGRPGDATDPHGHGTHVAGSILGDGSASSGQLRGTAPGAELYFQSIMDAKGDLGGLPWDLDLLFGPAYAEGARIHNDSWGAATDSEYTVNAIEVDQFITEHPDFLVVISAGNEGSAAVNRNARPGFADWLSVGSPASCKNALTVGASRSDRTSGGFAPLSYKQAWPGSFPDSPIADDKVSGDPESMAGFSGRGPCTDSRIKPDVVAPGTDIASVRASTAPVRSFWGIYPNNPQYAIMGGTSMAAPLVAGCAAVVRQYFLEERDHEPSAALLKATLVNGTRKLTGPDSVADFAELPNFHQGFGLVHLPTSLAVAPGQVLEFLDDWEGPGFTLSFERRRWRVQLGGGEELRLCLTWTDAPGRALQNDLDLLVETPTGIKLIGNEHLPRKITPMDNQNNLEIIRVTRPDPGDYLIQINAANLLTGNQTFALAVVGELTSPLRPS